MCRQLYFCNIDGCYKEFKIKSLLGQHYAIDHDIMTHLSSPVMKNLFDFYLHTPIFIKVARRLSKRKIKLWHSARNPWSPINIEAIKHECYSRILNKSPNELLSLVANQGGYTENQKNCYDSIDENTIDESKQMEISSLAGDTIANNLQSKSEWSGSADNTLRKFQVAEHQKTNTDKVTEMETPEKMWAAWNIFLDNSLKDPEELPFLKSTPVKNTEMYNSGSIIPDQDSLTDKNSSEKSYQSTLLKPAKNGDTGLYNSEDILPEWAMIMDQNGLEDTEQLALPTLSSETENVLPEWAFMSNSETLDIPEQMKYLESCLMKNSEMYNSENILPEWSILTNKDDNAEGNNGIYNAANIFSKCTILMDKDCSEHQAMLSNISQSRNTEMNSSGNATPERLNVSNSEKQDQMAFLKSTAERDSELYNLVEIEPKLITTVNKNTSENSEPVFSTLLPDVHSRVYDTETFVPTSTMSMNNECIEKPKQVEILNQPLLRNTENVILKCDTLMNKGNLKEEKEMDILKQQFFIDTENVIPKCDTVMNTCNLEIKIFDVPKQVFSEDAGNTAVVECDKLNKENLEVQQKVKISEQMHVTNTGDVILTCDVTMNKNNAESKEEIELLNKEFDILIGENDIIKYDNMMKLDNLAEQVDVKVLKQPYVMNTENAMPKYDITNTCNLERQTLDVLKQICIEDTGNAALKCDVLKNKENLEIDQKAIVIKQMVVNNTENAMLTCDVKMNKGSEEKNEVKKQDNLMEVDNLKKQEMEILKQVVIKDIGITALEHNTILNNNSVEKLKQTCSKVASDNDIQGNIDIAMCCLNRDSSKNSELKLLVTQPEQEDSEFFSPMWTLPMINKEPVNIVLKKLPKPQIVNHWSSTDCHNETVDEKISITFKRQATNIWNKSLAQPPKKKRKRQQQKDESMSTEMPFEVLAFYYAMSIILTYSSIVRIARINGKRKRGQIKLDHKQVVRWTEAPIDVYFKSGPISMKIKSLLTPSERRKLARGPGKVIKPVNPNLEVFFKE